MNKARVVVASWGGALLLSLGLRAWGHQHPEPLQAPFALVLLIVFAPALLLGLLLLNPGKGESGT